MNLFNRIDGFNRQFWLLLLLIQAEYLWWPANKNLLDCQYSGWSVNEQLWLWTNWITNIFVKDFYVRTLSECYIRIMNTSQNKLWDPQTDGMTGQLDGHVVKLWLTIMEDPGFKSGSHTSNFSGWVWVRPIEPHPSIIWLIPSWVLVSLWWAL